MQRVAPVVIPQHSEGQEASIGKTRARDREEGLSTRPLSIPISRSTQAFSHGSSPRSGAPAAGMVETGTPDRIGVGPCKLLSLLEVCRRSLL